MDFTLCDAIFRYIIYKYSKWYAHSMPKGYVLMYDSLPWTNVCNLMKWCSWIATLSWLIPFDWLKILFLYEFTYIPNNCLKCLLVYTIISLGDVFYCNDWSSHKRCHCLVKWFGANIIFQLSEFRPDWVVNCAIITQSLTMYYQC